MEKAMEKIAELENRVAELEQINYRRKIFNRIKIVAGIFMLVATAVLYYFVIIKNLSSMMDMI
jgi:hypothetical protein